MRYRPGAGFVLFSFLLALPPTTASAQRLSPPRFERATWPGPPSLTPPARPTWPAGQVAAPVAPVAQVAPVGRDAAHPGLLGLASSGGAVVGAMAGALAGGLIAPGAGDGEDPGLDGIIAGYFVGTGLGAALGSHLANRGRGELAASGGAATALGILGATVVFSDVPRQSAATAAWLTPVADIVVTTTLEWLTSPRRE